MNPNVSGSAASTTDSARTTASADIVADYSLFTAVTAAPSVPTLVPHRSPLSPAALSAPTPTRQVARTPTMGVTPSDPASSPRDAAAEAARGEEDRSRLTPRVHVRADATRHTVTALPVPTTPAALRVVRHSLPTALATPASPCGCRPHLSGKAASTAERLPPVGPPHTRVTPHERPGPTAVNAEAAPDAQSAPLAMPESPRRLRSVGPDCESPRTGSVGSPLRRRHSCQRCSGTANGASALSHSGGSYAVSASQRTGSPPPLSESSGHAAVVTTPELLFLLPDTNPLADQISRHDAAHDARGPHSSSASSENSVFAPPLGRRRTLAPSTPAFLATSSEAATASLTEAYAASALSYGSAPVTVVASTTTPTTGTVESPRRPTRTPSHAATTRGAGRARDGRRELPSVVPRGLPLAQQGAWRRMERAVASPSWVSAVSPMTDVTEELRRERAMLEAARALCVGGNNLQL